jgi:DNA polymerase IIIc chi subunit/predicted transcriptional regulator
LVESTKIEEGPHCSNSANPTHQTPIEVATMQNQDNSQQSSGGFVYFLATEYREFIKIGFSTSVVDRVYQLGTERPTGSEIRLLGCIPGTYQTERWFHKRFDAYRDKGEWFRSCPELSLLLEAMGFGSGILRGRKRKQIDASDTGLTLSEQAIRKIVRSETRTCLEAIVASAVPEFRRRIVGEHIKAAQKKMRESGEHIGRPFKVADAGEIWRMRNAGVSVTAIARQLKIGRQTVYDYLSNTRNAAALAAANAINAEE